MADVIDYYVSLNSPWTYLGHDRFVALAREHHKRIRIHAIDFGLVFAATGGLPLPKRSPQRRAYRLQELARWRDHLGLPIALQPANAPGNELKAAGMVHAARERGEDAVALAGAILTANWVGELDIGAEQTLLDAASACGLDGPTLLQAASAPGFPGVRERASRAAVEKGVFGAPTYLYGDAMFWGQDRLDFLARALQHSR